MIISTWLSNFNNLRWLTKVKILKCYSGFVRFETLKTDINLPIDARQKTFFFGFNLKVLQMKALEARSDTEWFG